LNEDRSCSLQFSKEKKHGGWIQISRGTDLILTRKSEHDDRAKKFALPSEEQQWQTTYQQWTKSVQKSYYSFRFKNSNWLIVGFE
jgi:hypothetical protein